MFTKIKTLLLLLKVFVVVVLKFVESVNLLCLLQNYKNEEYFFEEDAPCHQSVG